MDLVELLRKKIALLRDGPHIGGLQAVLVHIETAFGHLVRGQDSGQDTAFTDAIYRTNQAFEGSIKEAYRVLAQKDPGNKSPFEIERYFDGKQIFRRRVRDQFTRYRTEWRNPSTHDYLLDFDEREAFLAIVSVTAFCCLLVDQISEKFAFDDGRVEAQLRGEPASGRADSVPATSLQEVVVALLTRFCAIHQPPKMENRRPSEIELLGALRGFLSEISPELAVLSEPLLDGPRPLRPDLVIRNGSEAVLIEVKRPGIMPDGRAINQVLAYLAASGIRHGVLLFPPDGPSEMSRDELPDSGSHARIVTLFPAESSTSLQRTRR